MSTDFFLTAGIARRWYADKFGWPKAYTNVIVQPGTIGLVYPDHSLVYLEQAPLEAKSMSLHIWHKPNGTEEGTRLTSAPVQNKAMLLWVLDTHHKGWDKRNVL